jgi:hypothetical protein
MFPFSKNTAYMEFVRETSTVNTYAGKLSRFVIIALRLEYGDGKTSYAGLVDAGARLAFTPRAREALSALRRLCLQSKAHDIARDPHIDLEQLNVFLLDSFTGGLPEFDFHSGLTLYFGLLALRETGWAAPGTLSSPLAIFKYSIRCICIYNVVTYQETSEA